VSVARGSVIALLIVVSTVPLIAGAETSEKLAVKLVMTWVASTVPEAVPKGPTVPLEPTLRPEVSLVPTAA